MTTKEHFFAVVVGSGFGGSVTAYRLAEAGRRVLVLERGHPYPPGSFTRSPYRARESFWDPPHGLTGMYHYWSFRGIDIATIGVILMAVGALGILMSLLFWSSFAPFSRHDDVDVHHVP